MGQKKALGHYQVISLHSFSLFLLEAFLAVPFSAADSVFVLLADVMHLNNL